MLQADFAPERFHSRLNAEEKTYRYVLDTSPKTDVFRRRYVWTLGEALDGEAMERTARLLCGPMISGVFPRNARGKSLRCGRCGL